MSLLSLTPWWTRAARIAEMGREIAHRSLEDAWQRAGDEALELPPHQARGYLAARTAVLIRRATRAAMETSTQVPASAVAQVESQAHELLMTLLTARLRAARAAQVASRRRIAA